MDVVSSVISVILFVVFVPGVVFRLPAGGSRTTILVTHAVLFAIAASVVMSIYWSYREKFGNFGPTCPNGFSPAEDGGCVPTGHATYDPLKLNEKTA
jgi:hypothetical protein